MKRLTFVLAATGVVVLAGWLLHATGWLARSGAARASTTDPLSTPAGWRYRQSQPHHWRYIMLKH